MCFSPHVHEIFRHQNFKKLSAADVSCTFSLQNVLLATTACNFSTSELQKVVQPWGVLYILTWKMCFLPQRRAIFQHLNFKKCVRTFRFFNILTCECASRRSGVQFFNIWTSKSAPEPLVLTFWLANALLATAACNFSTSVVQKVVRSWRAVYIFTSKRACRHSGVQFLISPLTTWLRARRFNRSTFRRTTPWKNTALRDFSNNWRGCIFFLLTFALVHLLSADLTTLLCFSTVHVVES